MIPKRKFGISGVEASEIGFGAWTLGLPWWGEVDEERSAELVGRAIDLGITFFDTADTYGAGIGEERLGKALASRRGEVTIGTKFGYDITVPHDQGSHSERPTNWTPDHIRSACDASLGRLGTDVIDVYELHNPRTPQIRDDDIFEVCEELVAAGKIRAYGVALGPAIGWEEEGLDAIASRDISVVQTVFNLLEQRPGDVLIEAAGNKVGIMARVPHASDALVGKFKAGALPDELFKGDDHRAFRKRAWLERALTKVEQLSFLFEQRTVGQAALAWILAHPTITSVLPTVTTVEELEEYCAAASMPLTAGEYARVQELYRNDFGLPPERPEEIVPLKTSVG